MKLFIFIKRVIKFIKFYIVRNPRFAFAYALHFFENDFSFDVKFMTNSEYMEKVREGKSLVRIGDGEIYIMNKGSIHYQDYHDDIRNALFESVRNYNDNSSYVLAINEHAMNKSNKYLRAHNQFTCWLPMKTYYDMYFNKNATYVDATIFGYKNVFEEFVFPVIKDRHIIVVTKEETVNMLKSNKQINWDADYITVKPKNAYDNREMVYREVDAILSQHPESIILFSCGPAGKVFTLNYCKRGIQSLDVGIGLELIFNDKVLPYVILPKTRG